MARAPIVRPTDAPPAAHRAEVAVNSDGREDRGDAEASTVLPGHVAIIMDGNRRWARNRGLHELEGHPAGVEAIRGVLRHARRRGIRALTLYAFSRENWAREDGEVAALFGLLEAAIRNETDELRTQGVRVQMIGRMDELPEETRLSIDDALAATADGADMLLTIAFNYAGRTELVDAIRRIVASGVSAGDVDEALVASSLYTTGTPDPDLVIRTGGEERLSNFLLWQSAYAELVTTDTLWPDFDAGALDEALDKYASRQRRFGR
ncbi:MAG: polyprenyl diphosphate synthase [Chloroflexota bacterium]